MGGVFPGAASLEGFWRLIEAGTDACRSVPPGRWRLAAQSIRNAAPGTPDAVLTDRGCFLDDDFSGGELDASVEILLRAGRAAFDDGNCARRERHGIGIVLGNIAL